MRRKRPLFATVVLVAGCNSTCGACGDQPGVSQETTADAEAITAPPPIVRPRPPEIAAPPDVSTPPADAQRTASGLAYIVLAPGTGTVHPGRKDQVTVQQTGWTKSGQMIDSSVSRGQPISFQVDRVIRGWMEMLQLMVVGEKVRVWVPALLAYGDAKPGTLTVEQGGTPSGDLVFEIELQALQPAAIPDAGTGKPAHSGRDAGAGHKSESAP